MKAVLSYVWLTALAAAPLTAASANVPTAGGSAAEVKKIKISGYIQARYEADQSSQESFNADGSSNNNTFTVRRARIKLAASPTKRTLVVIQPDFTEKVTTKDAYAAYKMGDGSELAPTFTIGQFKWPFGYEILQSSSVRETPERSIVIQRLFPGERDQGVMVSSEAAGKLCWGFGLFNGTGANTKDNNDEKDLVGRLRYIAAPQLDLGISGYKGRQTVPPAVLPGPGIEGAKNRWGTDFQYYLSNASLKGEWIWGQDFAVNSAGGYLQLAANFGLKYVGVIKYDVFDPNTDVSNDKLTRWHLGIIRFLDEQTKFKLFYEINQEHPSKANNVFRAEVVAIF